MCEPIKASLPYKLMALGYRRVRVCEVRKRKVLELDPKEDRVWDDVKVGHSIHP